jgi:hypothetical protein
LASQLSRADRGIALTVLRSCSPRENVFDALGRKLELNESDALIAHYGEAFDRERKQLMPSKTTERPAASGSSEAPPCGRHGQV